MPKAWGSFAALFIERGMGMEYIQTSKRHHDNKTTEIYTHTTKKGFEKNNTVLFSHPKKGAEQHAITK